MRTATLLLTAALAACQTAPLPAPAPAASDQRLESIARDLLTNFNAGRYAEAAKDFNATMMSAMPTAKLAEFGQQFTGQAGAFRSVGAAQRAMEEGYRVVILPTQYDHLKVNVRVVFDANGKVAGLWFRPAA